MEPSREVPLAGTASARPRHLFPWGNEATPDGNELEQQPVSHDDAGLEEASRGGMWNAYSPLPTGRSRVMLPPARATKD